MIRKISILLIDNYDSFTYNLYDYFLQSGADCRVIRNDDLSLAEFQQLSFDALVFSPGPRRPTDAGLMMPLIAYFFNKKPILGICLGHQGIGEFFGATLQKNLPVHGKTSLLQHNGHLLFKGLPSTFKVMRYHSLILEDLDNTPLEIIAQTPEGEVMAIAHQSLPILGVQFHPESILTEYGLKMIQNWLSTIVQKA
jgi:anthranilate synthase/aminodeoxychorismate synthase-like glutamine amidotransferase